MKSVAKFYQNREFSFIKKIKFDTHEKHNITFNIIRHQDQFLSTAYHVCRYIDGSHSGKLIIQVSEEP